MGEEEKKPPSICVEIPHWIVRMRDTSLPWNVRVAAAREGFRVSEEEKEEEDDKEKDGPRPLQWRYRLLLEWLTTALLRAGKHAGKEGRRVEGWCADVIGETDTWGLLHELLACPVDKAPPPPPLTLLAPMELALKTCGSWMANEAWRHAYASAVCVLFGPIYRQHFRPSVDQLAVFVGVAMTAANQRDDLCGAVQASLETLTLLVSQHPNPRKIFTTITMKLLEVLLPVVANRSEKMTHTSLQSSARELLCLALFDDEHIGDYPLAFETTERQKGNSDTRVGSKRQRTTPEAGSGETPDRRPTSSFQHQLFDRLRVLMDGQRADDVISSFPFLLSSFVQAWRGMEERQRVRTALAEATGRSSRRRVDREDSGTAGSRANAADFFFFVELYAILKLRLQRTTSVLAASFVALESLRSLLTGLSDQLIYRPQNDARTGHQLTFLTSLAADVLKQTAASKDGEMQVPLFSVLTQLVKLDVRCLEENIGCVWELVWRGAASTDSHDILAGATDLHVALVTAFASTRRMHQLLLSQFAHTTVDPLPSLWPSRVRDTYLGCVRSLPSGQVAKLLGTLLGIFQGRMQPLTEHLEESKKRRHTADREIRLLVHVAEIMRLFYAAIPVMDPTSAAVARRHIIAAAPLVTPGVQAAQTRMMGRDDTSWTLLTPTAILLEALMDLHLNACCYISISDREASAPNLSDAAATLLRAWSSVGAKDLPAPIEFVMIHLCIHRLRVLEAQALGWDLWNGCNLPVQVQPHEAMEALAKNEEVRCLIRRLLADVASVTLDPERPWDGSPLSLQQETLPVARLWALLQQVPRLRNILVGEEVDPLLETLVTLVSDNQDSDSSSMVLTPRRMAARLWANASFYEHPSIHERLIAVLVRRIRDLLTTGWQGRNTALLLNGMAPDLPSCTTDILQPPQSLLKVPHLDPSLAEPLHRYLGMILNLPHGCPSTTDLSILLDTAFQLLCIVHHASRGRYPAPYLRGLQTSSVSVMRRVVEEDASLATHVISSDALVWMLKWPLDLADDERTPTTLEECASVWRLIVRHPVSPCIRALVERDEQDVVLEGLLQRLIADIHASVEGEDGYAFKADPCGLLRSLTWMEAHASALVSVLLDRERICRISVSLCAGKGSQDEPILFIPECCYTHMAHIDAFMARLWVRGGGEVHHTKACTFRLMRLLLEFARLCTSEFLPEQTASVHPPTSSTLCLTGDILSRASALLVQPSLSDNTADVVEHAALAFVDGICRTFHLFRPSLSLSAFGRLLAVLFTLFRKETLKSNPAQAFRSLIQSCNQDQLQLLVRSVRLLLSRAASVRTVAAAVRCSSILVNVMKSFRRIRLLRRQLVFLIAELATTVDLFLRQEMGADSIQSTEIVCLALDTVTTVLARHGDYALTGQDVSVVLHLVLSVVAAQEGIKIRECCVFLRATHCLTNCIKFCGEETVSSIPTFLLCVRRLLHCLTTSEFMDEKEECAREYVKLLEGLGQQEETMRDYITILLADFMVFVQHASFHPDVKKTLLSGFYTLLDACTPKELRFLYSGLSAASKPLFKEFYANYETFHRYRGKM